MDSHDRVRFLREGGQVTRAHTTPHHGTYNVAEHCYNMVTMLFQLYPGRPPHHIIEAILYHDAAERVLGDMPGPSKGHFEFLDNQYNAAEDLVLSRAGLNARADLTPHDEAWVKGLDCVEFWLWCHEQIAMGNRFFERPLERMTDRLAVMTLPPALKEFVDDYEWKRGPDSPV